LCLHGWELEILSIDDPWRTLYDLRCRKNLFADKTFDHRIAHLEFFRCVLLCYPAILPLEWLDVVIPAQASDPRSVPALLLSGLVPQAI
jgi:hypothetical protein